MFLENNKADFAVLGDLHLGRTLHGYDLTSAIMDVLYDFLQEIETRPDLDFCVLLGDVFDTNRPEQRHQTLFLEWVRAFVKSTPATLYILVGNHEALASKQTYCHSALGIVEAAGFSSVHVVSRPIYRGGFLFLPFPTPSFYKNQQVYDAEVHDLIEDMGVICAFTHLNLNGAKLNDTDWEYRGGDFTYNLPFDAIAGHIHKRQDIDASGPNEAIGTKICVLGAAGRLRFSEASNTPQMMFVRRSEVGFVDINFPKLRELYLEGENTQEILDSLLDMNLSKTLVKVQRRTDATVDWDLVEERLVQQGALSVKMEPIQTTNTQQQVHDLEIHAQDDNEAMEAFVNEVSRAGTWERIRDLWTSIKQTHRSCK